MAGRPSRRERQESHDHQAAAITHTAGGKLRMELVPDRLILVR